MGMGDDIGMDGEEDMMTHSGILSDNESVESSDVKDDTISLISSTNTTKPPRTKKRVQFLPDGFLVRVREIPPRSNKSSSESDGSASESSDSDDSDSESATESEDVSSERDTPSPAAPTESQNKFSTMPPLMYTAKGSYTISKSSGPKTGTAVAKITGINPSTVPPSPTNNNRVKSPPKRTRRSPSPKLEKRARKNSKNVDKVNNKKVSSQMESAKTNNKKRTPLKIKDGRISPPPFSKKTNNSLAPKSNGSVKLCQKRGNNISSIKSLTVRKTPSVVTTSLTALSTSSLTSESSLDRVSRAMQSLTLGKLYTVDGFIFPPHHARDLHLPDLTSTSKSEDFESSFTSTQKRPSIDLGSPRRSYQEGGVNQNPQQASPQSANRKRRYYAWQMANGSIQNTLNTTPSISQLWDSPGRSHSDSMDKASSNSR